MSLGEVDGVRHPVPALAFIPNFRDSRVSHPSDSDQMRLSSFTVSESSSASITERVSSTQRYDLRVDLGMSWRQSLLKI